MKKTTVLILLLGTALCAGAYQVRGKAKSNFGAVVTEEQTETETAPNQPRSFSSYSSHNWNKGVQTNRVQTTLAGEQVTQFEPLAPQASAPAAKPAAGKTAAKEGAAPAAAVAPAQAPKPTPTQASTQPAAGNAQVEQAMQQLQAVQDMMKNVGAMTGGNPSGAAGKNGQKQDTPVAIPGMPDVSSIFQGTGNPAAGRKK